jgi:hypothetical protein
MKKIILFSCGLAWLFISSLSAQSREDDSYVKLRIQKVNSREAADQYTYSAGNGASISLLQNADGQYADFSFACDFPKTGSQSTWIQGICRITPPGTGKYLLRLFQGEDPPKMAGLNINIDNNLYLADRQKGTSGTITISLYPVAASDYMYGTFEAILGDSQDPGEIKNLYKVSGEFKILRIQ